MILVYFASGRCFGDVVNNRTNHQFTSAISRTLHVRLCSNHSWRYEHNHFERCDENPRYQRQFFQNLDNFCI